MSASFPKLETLHDEAVFDIGRPRPILDVHAWGMYSLFGKKPPSINYNFMDNRTGRL
jgi:hypothetical protein